MAKFGDTLTTDDMPAGSTGGTGLVTRMSSTATSPAYTAASNPTDMTINAPLVAGRSYKLTFRSSWSTSGVYDINVTLPGALGVRSLGRISSSTTQWEYSTVFTAPSGFSAYAFTINLGWVSGTQSINLTVPGYERMLLLEDLGGSPIASNTMGLIAFAEATTDLGANFDFLDTLSVTPNLSTAFYYRIGLIVPCTVPATALGWQIRMGFTGFTLIQYYQLNSGAGTIVTSFTVMPTLTMALTLTPQYVRSSGTGNITIQGSATARRQLWVERLSAA